MTQHVPGPHARRLAALLLAAAFSIGLEGCGDVPTAPKLPEAPAGPPLLVVEASGTTAFEQVPAATADTIPVVESRALKYTKEIDGTKGGWVRCGRYFLVVAAGAFDSIGTVTMSMPDSTLMVVDVEITPSRLNHFNAPVYLAVNTTDTDVASDSLSMYWMDPGTRTWTDVTTAKTVTTATDCVTTLEGYVYGYDCPDASWASSGVSSTLQHFSRYSTGKAGW
jgi:hypothetical protein